MGIPTDTTAAGTPPAGDQANGVIAGTIEAIGPTQWFAFYGAFNVFIWGSRTAELTTVAGDLDADVDSATGFVVGQTVSGANIPAGTTIAAISSLTLTLALPPGYTAADIVSGVDAAAVFQSTATTASVQLERSFDGGNTWLVCGVGGAGALAAYTNPTVVSVVGGEPEKVMYYRLNCTAYAAGSTVNYRISATGILATSNGIPPG